MLKKVLAGTFLMAFIVTNGIAAYAIGDDDIIDNSMPIVNIDKEFNSEGEALEAELEDAKEVEIFEPKDKLITTDKIMLLSGKGLEGTRVLIEVYSVPELVKSDFTFEHLPEDDAYILYLSRIVDIGSSGLFVEEFELKLGLNKIVVYIVKTNEDIIEEETSKDLAEEISEDTVAKVSEDMTEEQKNEESNNDSEKNEGNSSLNEENIDEDIEKTKIEAKYVYVQDISKAQEKLDSIIKPGTNPGLDIPSKSN